MCASMQRKRKAIFSDYVIEVVVLKWLQRIKKNDFEVFDSEVNEKQKEKFS